MGLTALTPRGLLLRIAAQLHDPLVLLLLAAMAVTIALRDVTDAIVIVLVIVVNTTVGVVQEARADRAIEALRRLAAPTARVHRDGRDQTVPAAELVPGDVVRARSSSGPGVTADDPALVDHLPRDRPAQVVSRRARRQV